jgi:TonB family protein
MSSERSGVRGDGAESAATQKQENFAVLRECLIGGDAEQTRRERRLRRRSLAISTLLQALVVLAIVAIPFLGRVERIAMANVTPIPPYRPYGTAREHPATPRPQLGERPAICFLCPPAHPTKPSVGGHQRSVDGTDPTGDIDPSTENTGGPCEGCINMGRTEGPKPPVEPFVRPSIVHVTHLDPAMLLERIEPMYPALARQMRRNGRVELHAIITADGRIESLEVVSGDALFYQSALDAVRRWRYRPTMLNGQAVRVDTCITVVYTMQ